MCVSGLAVKIKVTVRTYNTLLHPRNTHQTSATQCSDCFPHIPAWEPGPFKVTLNNSEFLAHSVVDKSHKVFWFKILLSLSTNK